MTELYQLYNDQGKPLIGQGATREDALTKGLLHAASHVWMWRHTANGIEVLLQKRASTMRTWPGHLDISAAGHVNLGEKPETAALREVEEEIGIKLQPADLHKIHTYDAYITTAQGDIENEYQWLYLVQLPHAENSEQSNFKLQQGEVSSLVWKDFDDFKREALDPEAAHYVPHGDTYFKVVIDGIEQAAQETA